MEKLKSFAQCMQLLARRKSVGNVFSDFLEMSVCALTLGAMEERYLEIVRGYDKPEAYLMAEAFAALVNEMDDRGNGLKDVFGDFFMEHISHGHNGQFFTPEGICGLMARIGMELGAGSLEHGEDAVENRVTRVLDCACGSGRTLLAAERVRRLRIPNSRDGMTAMYYGADVDRNCAMMCVINFCLNGMLGEVAWMNSLSNRFYGGWQVRMHPSGVGPYIVGIGEDESEIVLRESKELKVIKEVKEFKADLLDEMLDMTNKKGEVQQMMFDF